MKTLCEINKLLNSGKLPQNGPFERATISDMVAGTDDKKIVTPKVLVDYIKNQFKVTSLSCGSVAPAPPPPDDDGGRVADDMPSEVDELRDEIAQLKDEIANIKLDMLQ